MFAKWDTSVGYYTHHWLLIALSCLHRCETILFWIFYHGSWWLIWIISCSRCASNSDSCRLYVDRRVFGVKIEKQNAAIREEMEEKTRASIRAAESTSLLSKLSTDLSKLSNMELSGDQRAIETAKDMKYLYDRQKSLVSHIFLKFSFGELYATILMTNLCVFNVFFAALWPFKERGWVCWQVDVRELPACGNGAWV